MNSQNNSNSSLYHKNDINHPVNFYSPKNKMNIPPKEKSPLSNPKILDDIQPPEPNQKLYDVKKTTTDITFYYTFQDYLSNHNDVFKSNSILDILMTLENNPKKINKNKIPPSITFQSSIFDIDYVNHKKTFSEKDLTYLKKNVYHSLLCYIKKNINNLSEYKNFLKYLKTMYVGINENDINIITLNNKTFIERLYIYTVDLNVVDKHTINTIKYLYKIKGFNNPININTYVNTQIEKNINKNLLKIHNFIYRFKNIELLMELFTFLNPSHSLYQCI